MNFFNKTIFKNIVIVCIIFSITIAPLGLKPKKAVAQAVPNDCSLFSFYCIQDNLKEFVLNTAAVMIANQILQKMTASIVNWINTGFEGSPAFLTNPEGFFLDLADQITGQFLTEEWGLGGKLSPLCSPFSFDIRLNLALKQSGYNAGKRYTCTLGTIINNTKNAVDTAGQNSGINVYGSDDGASIGNFVNGDFNEGGWAAFMAYTLEPQNNPVSVSLMAQSDLQQAIDRKQAAVNTDLNRGGGFLSWNKCDDITAQMTGPSRGNGLSANEIASLDRAGNQSLNLSRGGTVNDTGIIKKTTNPDTKITKYEKCQTQTPGSIIGGSLQSTLNIGRDKLVLVDTLSDSVDAILGALVNQMLTQGLAALSQKGTGVKNYSGSYLTQLANEAENVDSVGSRSLRERGDNAASSLINQSESSITTYNRAVSLLSDSRQKFIQARICFESHLSQPSLLVEQKTYAERQIASINATVANDIDGPISIINFSVVEITRAINDFQNALGSTAKNDVPNFTGSYIEERFAKLDSLVSKSAKTTQAGIDTATNADTLFRTTTTKVSALDKDAKKYQTRCDTFPNSVYANN